MPRSDARCAGSTRTCRSLWINSELLKVAHAPEGSCPIRSSAHVCFLSSGDPRSTLRWYSDRLMRPQGTEQTITSGSQPLHAGASTSGAPHARVPGEPPGHAADAGTEPDDEPKATRKLSRRNSAAATEANTPRNERDHRVSLQRKRCRGGERRRNTSRWPAPRRRRQARSRQTALIRRVIVATA